MKATMVLVTPKDRESLIKHNLPRKVTGIRKVVLPTGCVHETIDPITKTTSGPCGKPVVKERHGYLCEEHYSQI